MKTKSQRKNFKVLTGKAGLMTGIIMAILLSTSLLCSAADTVYKMDFNTFQYDGGYVGGESAWNTYAAPANVTGTIKDTSGSYAAGITLNYTGNLEDTTHSSYFTNPTGGASWATTDGSLGNTQAVGDYFKSDSTDSPAVFTFGGLTAGTKISLDIFSSSTAPSDSPRGYFSYSLDGGTTYLGFNVLEKDGTVYRAAEPDYYYFNARSWGNDNAYYMNISSLTVGASGTVLVKVLQDPGYGRYAVISAMQLTTTPVQGTLISIQ